MTTRTHRVTGGVDTHTETHHAAALDEVGRLLGTREFRAGPDGYVELLEWLRSFGAIDQIGVEGTGCYGAGLTRFLRCHNQSVIEVNRPNRRARRTRGKSDPLDAESAARRALAGEDHVIPKDTTTVVEAIRALRIARTGAVKSRTAAYNQLRDLILTAPEPLRENLRGKTLHRVALESARLRPDMSNLANPSQATKLALRTIGHRVAALNTEVAALDIQLGQLVRRAAPRTLELVGVGTENAAQLLITAGGNPERLRSEASFAALCAASPIPASSGKTTRYRLNPAGDRDANRALYIITLVRMRYCPQPALTSSVARPKASAKREIIRCVKRYVARQTYHAIRADLTALPTLDDL